jgi:hypothetical protein
MGSLAVMGMAGLILVISAFGASRPSSGPPGSSVPPAQVVESTTSPIIPPRDHAGRQVSGGRLFFGLLLMVIGGTGLFFVYAGAGLASLANH